MLYFLAFILIILVMLTNNKIFKLLFSIVMFIILLPLIGSIIVFLIALLVIALLFGDGIRVKINNGNDFRWNNVSYGNNYEEEYKKACDTIGVNVSDTYEEKKKARNNLLKKYHPDFYQDEKEKEKATSITNMINAAWEVIEKYEKMNKEN